MKCLESFLDGRREGNFRKVTKEYEKLLLEIIEKEPAEYGYEFGRWTAARLATYRCSSSSLTLCAAPSQASVGAPSVIKNTQGR